MRHDDTAARIEWQAEILQSDFVQEYVAKQIAASRTSIKWQVVYIDALGNLARAEFSAAETARTRASEHAQSSVIHGDPVMDHYVGPRK